MEDITQIRGHHLIDIHVVALLGVENRKIRRFIGSYTNKMWEYKLDIHRRLIENPESLVEIVASLDFLCHYDCPKLRDECTDEMSRKVDIYAANKYGLKIDTIYTSGLIVNLLRSREYRSLNGVIQPILNNE